MNCTLHTCLLLGLMGALQALCGCTQPLDEMDSVFYRWDGRMHCAVNIDDRVGVDLDTLPPALERATRESSVLELFTHAPGRTLRLARLEQVLQTVYVHHLPFITYDEMISGERPRAAVALGFDDDDVDSWLAAIPLLQRFEAKATFFVTRYATMADEHKAGLRRLAASGHDIQAHGKGHKRAPLFVEQYGLSAYVREEALPSLEALTADGFAPTMFAYPFGARTKEIDQALMPHTQALRSVSFARGAPVVASPCPHD